MDIYTKKYKVFVFRIPVILPIKICFCISIYIYEKLSPKYLYKDTYPIDTLTIQYNEQVWRELPQS